ncbi:MAG: hypothetical protein ABIO46_08040 [Chitinophagales bacterium]
MLQPAGLRFLYPSLFYIIIRYLLSVVKSKRTPVAAATLFCNTLLILFPLAGRSQSPAPVLANRVTDSWRMEKMIQGNKSTVADQSMGDFMLIIHADKTVEQGMSPDGLIKGTWTIDEQSRLLTIKDNETEMVYKMKIITVSADELVLQDQSVTAGVTIYYHAKR